MFNFLPQSNFFEKKTIGLSIQSFINDFIHVEITGIFSRVFISNGIFYRALFVKIHNNTLAVVHDICISGDQNKIKITKKYFALHGCAY